jgi:hypothetical protein
LPERVLRRPRRHGRQHGDHRHVVAGWNHTSFGSFVEQRPQHQLGGGHLVERAHDDERAHDGVDDDHEHHDGRRLQSR